MIHVHMEGIARLIRIKNGTPIIRTIHNITSVSNEYPKFDKLFAISKAVQKRTLGQGFDSKVIYNGIHFDQVATSPHAMGQTCHIVNVGRLQNDKGQKVLVEAAKILKKQGDIHFTIDFIGGGENDGSVHPFGFRCWGGAVGGVGDRESGGVLDGEGEERFGVGTRLEAEGKRGIQLIDRGVLVGASLLVWIGAIASREQGGAEQPHAEQDGGSPAYRDALHKTLLCHAMCGNSIIHRRELMGKQLYE